MLPQPRLLWALEDQPPPPESPNPPECPLTPLNAPELPPPLRRAQEFEAEERSELEFRELCLLTFRVFPRTFLL
jgi:hypothetical protein